MNNQLKSIIVIIIVISAVVGFFWIAKFFGGGESVESEKPLVICQPQNAPPAQQKCNWTAHIHAHVEVFRGGQEVPLGFEQGELEKSHTHAEKNKIHWHGLIPIDPNMKEIKDRSFFEIGNLPRELKIPLEDKPKFIVNSKEVEPSYLWQDGDHIEIRYE